MSSYDISTTSTLDPENEIQTSSPSKGVDARFQDLEKYIGLGCLGLRRPLSRISAEIREWTELRSLDLAPEDKDIIGADMIKLLDAGWVRLFAYHLAFLEHATNRSIRVYVLPEDWGRRFISRSSKSLKAALRKSLECLDTSLEAWTGKLASTQKFDPWARAEDVSLHYLFNMLPSPATNASTIRNRFARRAVEDLLDSTSPSSHGSLPLDGLLTPLYPYQSRSASLMIEKEAAPQLKLDPRLEIRHSPNGETFFFSAREGSFLKEPKYYETNRGGILAETMGLGKTIICLSVILTTRGHAPEIPAAYFPPPTVRTGTGSLKDMAASTIGRHSIPAKDEFNRMEAYDGIDLGPLKDALVRNTAFYEIPPEVPRMNRTTQLPPPRQLVICSGTIVIVPRNLLHQWQSEIRKHVAKGSLKVLVCEAITRRSAKIEVADSGEEWIDHCSVLPAPTKLMNYDLVLFSRNRFEQEIADGVDKIDRRARTNSILACRCSYIGATRIPDCTCRGQVYESPLLKMHWLRIIVDEGHSFSSSLSNAVLLAKQVHAERRWVVSGTPAKSLVGVELELSSTDASFDPELVRKTLEQRREFVADDETTKAVKAIGLLASNFLMVRPWSDTTSEGKLDWDEYTYRHEHQYRKTYTAFSSCFLRTLEALVVKTQPHDVEKDIKLPSMIHRTVILKPCWFDKMTANLFIQVIRANAITSERTDVDYLFNKNNIKPRHSLIRNLRRSNFTWTGFGLKDVEGTLKETKKYLEKPDKNCSAEDVDALLESSSIVASLAKSDSWLALSRAHEVGMAVEDFPLEAEDSFALIPERPTMVGIAQLLDGQLHIDSRILTGAPSEGLEAVGKMSKARHTLENVAQDKRLNMTPEAQASIAGVKVSVTEDKITASRRSSGSIMVASPRKPKVLTQKECTTTTPEEMDAKSVADSVSAGNGSVSIRRPRKRKLTLSDELAQLPEDSPLCRTRIVGTTSAKLTYLITKVTQYHATDKIIIFYDGDNAAYYIAQCLELLYVNHRIYARTLDNTTRSAYVTLFNEDSDVRVLLIDVACGALGLNLNAASIVLILNPINRPDLEAQAIKRAHRIGQTKEVLVETLVLEGTIEEAIFKRARKMSRQQHLKARDLEDDADIVSIIQNAKVLPVDPGESEGFAKFAPLMMPERVFGRPNRDKYHRFGLMEAKVRPKKRAKLATEQLMVEEMNREELEVRLPQPPWQTSLSQLGSPITEELFDSNGASSTAQVQRGSLFGG